jgi:hypothetical protein
MSREELKSAITELLENSPEQALQEVLIYLKAIQGSPDKSVTFAKNLRTILTEDKELLKRLAL